VRRRPRGAGFILRTVTTNVAPMPLEGELVPHARHCLKMGRTPWILFQLVSKVHNVIVDATGVRVAACITTNLFHQLCACDDAIGVLKEKLQSLELMGRQLD